MPEPQNPVTAELEETLNTISNNWAYSRRSPVLHSPAESDLEWEDAFFPSADGTPLEAWFIPRMGSDKLIICSHPLGFSRSGFPSHLEPWKSAFGPGNDYELNFIPDYKILHESGYNVLAFDFRNFGQSSAANGGLQSNNRFEARDVLGSLSYVQSRSDLSQMKVGLFSRCMGANATFRAIATQPKAFENVKALVAPLLLSARVALERALEGMKLLSKAEEVERRIHQIAGTYLSESSPVDWAKHLTMPTLTYGVREDAVTRTSDLEAIFAAIASPHKQMFWIDGNTTRWDGYTWFQRNPKQILDWFSAFLS